MYLKATRVGNQAFSTSREYKGCDWLADLAPASEYKHNHSLNAGGYTTEADTVDMRNTKPLMQDQHHPIKNVTGM
jgi:hypothetical protein